LILRKTSKLDKSFEAVLYRQVWGEKRKNEVRTNIVSLNELTLVHLDFEGKTTVYLQYVDCTKHSNSSEEIDTA